MLARTVTNLEKLEISYTKLTQHQIVTILTALRDGSKMTKLDISFNDMTGVDPKLLAKAVIYMKNWIHLYQSNTASSSSNLNCCQ